MKKSVLKIFLCKFAGHKWSEWRIDKRKCVQKRNCQRCGEMEYQKIDHNWNRWSAVDKACQEKRMCVHCGMVDMREVSHEWSPWRIVKNRCVQIRHCVRCMKKEDVRIEHDWSEWQEDGCQEIRTCQNCSFIERHFTGSNHRWEITNEKRSEYSSYSEEYRTVWKSRCIICGEEYWSA